MNSVEKFNTLNGQKISRADLLTLATQAFDEQQFRVHERLTKVLDKHPKAKYYILNILSPEVFDNAAHGMSKPKKKSSKPSPKQKECDNRVKCDGLKPNGKLKKGYKFTKGGTVVKAMASPKRCINRRKCDGLNANGTLKKGYRFVKGGAIVKALKKPRPKFRKRDHVKVKGEKTIYQVIGLVNKSNPNSKENVYQINNLDKNDIRALSESKLIRVSRSKKTKEPTSDQVYDLVFGLHYGYNREKTVDALGKPVSPTQIYDMITQKVIDAIKSSKDLFWRKSWQSQEYGLVATNYVSKKPYHGVNALLLNFLAPLIRKKPIKNPYWLTIKQIEKLKGKLKKGSKGHEVIYYSYVYKITQENPEIDFSSMDAKKFNAFVKNNKEKINSTAKISKIPILRYYNVFSADDVEGVKLEMPKVNKPKLNERIESAEYIVKNMPNTPKLNLEDKGDSAHYIPALDTVTMPKLSFFDGAQEYYSTFFHELVHATGNKKRLDRDLSGTFGTKSYAFEELIAELGAVFLCAESGILFRTLNNSAAYLKGWKKRLLDKLTEDNKFIFRASSNAQKAADYILDRDKNGKPKYLKLKLKQKFANAASKRAKKRPTVDELKNKVKTIEPLGEFHELAAKNKVEFEKQLKKLGFEIVDIDTKWNSIKDFKRHYKLNYKDVAGIEIIIEVSSQVVSSNKPKTVKADYEILFFDGSKVEDFIPDGDLQWLYEEILYELNKRFSLSVTEASTIRDKYANTLFTKKDENQLALFGKKSKKSTASKYDYDTILKLKNNVLKQLDSSKSGHIAKNFLENISEKAYKNDSLKIELGDWLTGKTNTIALKRLLSESKYNNDNLSHFNAMTALDSTKRTKIPKKRIIKQLGTAYIDLGNAPLPPVVQPIIAPEVKNDVPLIYEEPKSPIKQEWPAKKINRKSVDSPYVQNLRHVKNTSKPTQNLNLKGDLAQFLGNLERKHKHSLVITLDAPPGAGKTRVAFQVANMAANSGYTSGFVSLEEHPQSKLFKDKAAQYISSQNEHLIDVVEELPPTYDEFIKMLDHYDFPIIDSWNKVFEFYNVDFDNDLRKRLDGKIIFAIFQRTQDGKMRGGSRASFDGDIILEVEKKPDFRESYLMARKNRYQDKPLNEIGYNIYSQKLINPEAEAEKKAMPQEVFIQ